MKAKIIFLAFLISSSALVAQTDALNGFCVRGGTQSVTAGLSSSNYLQGIIPHCTITVYLTGTLTKATLFQDAVGTPLTNPFKAKIIGTTGAGQWLFYADDSFGYDIVASGGDAPNTYPSPLAICTDCKVGSSGGGGGGPSVLTNGTPNISQSVLNFVNPAIFNGLTFGFSNPAGGNETFAISGTLNNSGLTNSSTSVNGQTCSLGGSCTITAAGTQVQVNAVNLTSPTPVNFADSSTVKFTNPLAGEIQASVIVGSGVAMAITPPVAGQYVIIYPTSNTLSSPTGTNSVADNISGDLFWGCTGVLCNLAPDTTSTWSTFSLPFGLSAGSVTNVYAFSINNGLALGASISSTFTCSGTGIGAVSVVPVASTWSEVQTTTLTTASGSNLNTMSCTATLIAGGAPGPSGLHMAVPAIGLIVYYTGAPVSVPNKLYVQIPLFYNSSLSSLGIDTSAIGTGFPITIGSTSIAANSTTSSISGLTLVSPILTGTPNASGAAEFKLPVASGFTTLANGEIGYDTTNNNWHGWVNGADTLFAPLASGFVSGHCGQPTSSGGSWLFADTGSACGTGSGSGLTSLNSLTGPALSITSTDGSIGITPAGTTINLTTVAHQPAQITTTFVGVPANNQIMLYVPASVAMTVPSSCTGSFMKAAVAATSSAAFLVKDLTTSTTLCTATFSGSGTVATLSGSGGSISTGDIIEIIGPASADATLATIGANVLATR